MMEDFDRFSERNSKQDFIGSLLKLDLRDLELRILTFALEELKDGSSSNKLLTGHHKSKQNKLGGTYTDKLWEEYLLWLFEDVTKADPEKDHPLTSSGFVLEKILDFLTQKGCEAQTSIGLVSGLMDLQIGTGMKLPKSLQPRKKN